MAQEALLGWVEACVSPNLCPESLQDLQDGKALATILLDVDSEFFERLEHDTSLDTQRRLTAAFFAEQLKAALPPTALNNTDIPHLITLILSLAVQSEKAQKYVDTIQQLEERHQETLMRAIENVTSSLERKKDRAPPNADTPDPDKMDPEQLKTAFKSTRLELDTLQGVYEDLRSQFNHLRDENDRLTAAQGESNEEAQQDETTQSDQESLDRRRSRTDSTSAAATEELEKRYRAELDRLQYELHTAVNNFAEAENNNTTAIQHVQELQQQVDEYRLKAEEADKLKDEVDELRHASDRLSKSEAVIEKYKKKLEDAADVRRSLKTLEQQNASLVDVNASLEEANANMKSYKPLLDQYKNQVGDLEEKLAASTKETERLSFELERTIQALKSAEDERDARDAQQRVMEMENIGQELAARKAARTTDPQSPNNSNQLAIPSDSDDEGASAANDSFDTNTMTQLRLQVRQLQKQAAAASSGTDSSRTLVLQNLLDDANRMKERYEADYLAEMRAKLKAEGQLEEVRKAAGRDDGPTTIALRLRLNEIVEELDALKKEHAQTAQQLETVEKELVVAKSNLNLVNQDQLSIVNKLRSSVSQESTLLHEQLDEVKKRLESAEETRKMQSSQIQKLLLDKIELQGDSISQRERMLAREQSFSELKRSVSQGEAATSVQPALTKMEDQLKIAHAEVAELQNNLEKARTFIRQQDALAREKYTALGAQNVDAEKVAEYENKIRKLQIELERALSATGDLDLKYRKEQTTLLSNLQKMNLDNVCASLSSSSSNGTWLGMQRARAQAALGR